MTYRTQSNKSKFCKELSSNLYLLEGEGKHIVYKL